MVIPIGAFFCPMVFYEVKMNENDDQQVDGMDDFPSMAKWFFEAWLWQVLIFRLFNSHQSHITQYDFPESYYPVADSIYFFFCRL